jgi:hypothetical protein
MAAVKPNGPLDDLLVKIEIDTNSWVNRSPGEKLALLAREVKKNSEKLVTAAGGFIEAFAGLIRSNTESPAVNAWLSLAETGMGLVRANTVLGNVFISARREVHSPFDELARFMDAGKGIELVTDSMDATPSICETFLGLTDAEQAKYGIRFRKVRKADEDADVQAGSGEMPTVFMVDAEWDRDGAKQHIGFEVGFYETKSKGDRLTEDISAYINFGIPGRSADFDVLWEVPSFIYGIYIDKIDVTKNIVRIKNGVLYVEPRVVVDFDVRNFDLYDGDGTPVRTMESESAFIRKVLDRKGRRGYIVQGDQGTGKTISVNKLLMDFPDVPVFWISPDSITDRRGMDNVFRVLDMFPGSFFVFDDFDGNNFADKNDLTGAFINYIDETNSPKYRGITILIINEPQKLHSTIKLRPGRIDDIIYVKNPGTVAQVADVVEQSFRHLGVRKPDWASPDDPGFAAACEPIFGAHLTHAYISGVVTDMVRYSSDEVTLDKFRELVSRRIATIKYARMVALDDGHIVDGDAPKVAEPEAINSRVRPGEAGGGAGEM